MLQSRVRIGRTPFDARWNRVAGQRLSRSRLRAAVGLTSGMRDRTIDEVNRWANRNIAYVEDRALYGRSDHWASASETLRRRKGDCEDYAILKMQMLIAAGIPREDIMLTVARDLVRNADHAFLVVRSGDRDLLLDNNTDRLLDASVDHDYRPIMSFDASGKWLHGRALPAMRLASVR